MIPISSRNPKVRSSFGKRNQYISPLFIKDDFEVQKLIKTGAESVINLAQAKKTLQKGFNNWM